MDKQKVAEELVKIARELVGGLESDFVKAVTKQLKLSGRPSTRYNRDGDFTIEWNSASPISDIDDRILRVYAELQPQNDGTVWVNIFMGGEFASMGEAEGGKTVEQAVRKALKPLLRILPRRK